MPAIAWEPHDLNGIDDQKSGLCASTVARIFSRLFSYKVRVWRSCSLGGGHARKLGLWILRPLYKGAAPCAEPCAPQFAGLGWIFQFRVRQQAKNHAAFRNSASEDAVEFTDVGGCAKVFVGSFADAMGVLA